MPKKIPTSVGVSRQFRAQSSAEDRKKEMAPKVSVREASPARLLRPGISLGTLALVGYGLLSSAPVRVQAQSLDISDNCELPTDDPMQARPFGLTPWLSDVSRPHVTEALPQGLQTCESEAVDEYALPGLDPSAADDKAPMISGGAGYGTRTRRTDRSIPSVQDSPSIGYQAAIWSSMLDVASSAGAIDSGEMCSLESWLQKTCSPDEMEEPTLQVPAKLAEPAMLNSGPPPTLRTIIAALAKLKVLKYFLAEVHRQEGNLEMAAQALAGLIDGLEEHQTVSFYREMWASPPSDQTHSVDPIIEKAMTDMKSRPAITEHLIKVLRDKADVGSGPSQKLFKEVLKSNRLQPKLMSFKNPSRRDMDRFLADKDFAVASVGLAHALYKFESLNKLKMPWSAVITPMANGYKTMDQRLQKTLWDGMERSEMQAPTALVLQSEAWSFAPDNPQFPSRSDMYQHFHKKGYVIMEVPLGKNGNATIIAPGIAREMLREIARGCNNRVSLVLD